MEGFFRNLFNPQQRRENRRNNRNRRPNSTNSTNRTNAANGTNASATNPRRPRPASSPASSPPAQQRPQHRPQQSTQHEVPASPPPDIPSINGIPINQLPQDILELIMQQAEAAGLATGEGTAFNFTQAANGTPQEVFTSQAPPPASSKSIRQLPIVAVTPADLVDESNRECCICFEPHSIHEKVCRLPCAHIFHVKCIHSWLEKHCTCPICRYEIPTDNGQYEEGRKERMKGIKPRYAKYELERMAIRDLKRLCERLNFKEHDIVGLDRRGVVDVILESGRIDVINAPDPVEYESIEVLRGMGVGKLKRAMVEAGVFFDPIHVVEKEDMVQIFVNSGRIVFRREPTEQSSSHPMVREYEHESQPSSISDSASMPYRDWERLESGEIKRARLSSNGTDEESSSTTTIDLTEQDANSKGGRKFEDGSGHAESVQSLNANMDSASEPEETMQVETDTGETCYYTSPGSAAATAASTSSDPHSTTCWSTSSFTNRSVGELRQLAAQFDIDLSGCIEKKDMVEKLVSALT